MSIQQSTAILAICVAICTAACSDGSDGGDGNNQELEKVLDFEAYTWEEISSGNHWDPRAGLQSVELNGRFFVLGVAEQPAMERHVIGSYQR